MKREFCLIKPYSDDRWSFTGSTVISTNAVRLTADSQGQRGSIWSTLPNSMPNWEVHIHFKVHGNNRDLFGDGFAFWYAKESMINGPVFGSKDNFKGLSVFFDTYANQNGAHNHGHPYVSGMVNNGSQSYDHDRDGTHTELDGCESSFRMVAAETFAAIRYQKNKLMVSMIINGKPEWISCFSSENIHLPTGYYFGLSATTGDLTDNHDIYSVKVFDLSDGTEDYAYYEGMDPSAEFQAQPRDHIDDPELSVISKLGGWRLALIIIIGLLGLVVCLMIGYILWSRNQQMSRKRLY